MGSVGRWSCCHLPRLALLHLVHLQRLLGGEQQRREDVLTPRASDFLGCCLTGLLRVAKAGGIVGVLELSVPPQQGVEASEKVVEAEWRRGAEIR